MAITFEPLRAILKQRDLNLNFLRKSREDGGLGLSPLTVNKISHDDPVSFEVLDTICREMKLRVDEVIQYNDGLYKRGPLRKRDFELTAFLEQTNTDVSHYIELLKMTGESEAAYNKFWTQKQLTPPNRWTKTPDNTPMVSIKLHPAGGKYVLALNAMCEIISSAAPSQGKPAVWLTARTIDINQTIRMIRLILKKNRNKLNSSFPEAVEIFSEEQPFLTKEQLEHETENSLRIIVVSCEDFALMNEKTRDTAAAVKSLHPVLIIDGPKNLKGAWFTDITAKISPSFILELAAKPSTASNLISTADID